MAFGLEKRGRMEVKHLARPLLVKELAEDGVFTGYASVFGAVDNHDEVVAAGAFRRTLANWQRSGRMPAMLWMHDPGQPVGVWMNLVEDSNGLAVQGRLAMRTQKGGEAFELLKLGAVTGLSIGYRVVASRIEAAKRVRVLTEIELFEISLVTFPANEAARIDPPKQAGGEVREAAARLRRAARKLGER